MAAKNAQDGISLIQTAEGALGETHAILQRMRELAVQASTDTNTADDRTKIQAEIDQLAKEITRISNTTEFNTKNLLAGGLSTVFHIGANQDQNVNMGVNAMDAFSLGVAAAKNIGGVFDAGATSIDTGVVNSDLGLGLTAQTYKILVTKEASNASGAGVAFTDNDKFTGARDENAVFKITTVDGDGKVTGVQVSLDGGTSYGTAGIGTITQTGDGGEFVYKGVTVSISAATSVDDQFSIEFTAQYNTLALQDSSGVQIGATVNAYQDMTSVTIGDQGSARTMIIRGANLGALDAGTATQEVSSLASNAAVTGANGEIITKAEAVAGIDVSNQIMANKAITTINNALEKVSEERSKLGAYQNRLDHTINNLSTSAENLQAAESRIRDVDYAAAA